MQTQQRPSSIVVSNKRASITCNAQSSVKSQLKKAAAGALIAGLMASSPSMAAMNEVSSIANEEVEITDEMRADPEFSQSWTGRVKHMDLRRFYTHAKEKEYHENMELLASPATKAYLLILGFFYCKRTLDKDQQIVLDRQKAELEAAQAASISTLEAQQAAELERVRAEVTSNVTKEVTAKVKAQMRMQLQGSNEE